MTPLTCEGLIRLKLSQEMLPKASGVTNSVARTRPKRSTTVSQKIAERIQWRAARSGNGDGRVALSVSGAGASPITLPGSGVRSPIAGADHRSVMGQLHKR